MKLAENEVIIENYLLAILMSESLPSFYDYFVLKVFASIRVFEKADSNCLAVKIFEEELPWISRSEDVRMATQRNCHNCEKPGQFNDNYYVIGGGKKD